MTAATGTPRAALTALALLAAASCDYRPTEDDVVGAWIADDGGLITFHRDGTLQLEDVDIGCIVQGYPSGPRETTAGTWTIHPHQFGQSPSIELQFESSAGRSMEGELLTHSSDLLHCPIGDPDAGVRIEFRRVGR